MARTAQIRCVNKIPREDPHKAITHIGGFETKGWRLAQQEAIRLIEDGKWDFFVEVDGDRVEVEVAVSRFGNKYLKTVADGDEPNNLLSLPECPA
jgi:uncharacterized protein DUF3892